MIHHYSKLVFIDLETTGPNPASDAITEIGIVEVDAAGVTRWSSLVNPQTPIPPFIRQLTGISDDMVRDAPTFDMLHEQLLERLQGGLFIAHNARFDYGFLRNAFAHLGKTFRCEVLCTVKLSRRLFPAEARHSLDALVARHGLSAQARHRALADADLLWQFWRVLQATVGADALADATERLLQRPNLPLHIEQELLDDLPDTPGVYVFRGEQDAPLHVGRAAHLRQRVLSHFHADQPSRKDAQLARELRRIDWHETAGEIGAQLLEAHLLRRLQPLYDTGPQAERELCAWQLRDAGAGHSQPVLAFASEQDFGSADRLYGLFTSRSKAEAALHALADRHELCPVMLGLEHRSQPGRPCFGYQLHRCRGACVGKEPAMQHQQRLEHALAPLQLTAWPHAGPVLLAETGAAGRRDLHVVNNWCFLGTVQTEQDAWRLLREAPAHPPFEADTYRILLRAIAQGKLLVHPLAAEEAAANVSA